MKRENISRKSRIKAHEALIELYKEGKTTWDVLIKCPLCFIIVKDKKSIGLDDCKRCTVSWYDTHIELTCMYQKTFGLIADSSTFEPRIAFHKQIIRWLKSGYTLRQLGRRLGRRLGRQLGRYI